MKDVTSYLVPRSAVTSYLVLAIDTSGREPKIAYACTLSEFPPTTTPTRSFVLVAKAHGENYAEASQKARDLAKPGGIYEWVARAGKGLK